MMVNQDVQDEQKCIISRSEIKSAEHFCDIQQFSFQPIKRSIWFFRPNNMANIEAYLKLEKGPKLVRKFCSATTFTLLMELKELRMLACF